ncbi:MAG: hypothetical protein Q9219_007205, partial [cf. Caloplaca sp. 3 TL-2023]
MTLIRTKDVLLAKDLLGARFNETPRINPDRPKPLAKISNYDGDRVKQTLTYLDKSFRNGRNVNHVNRFYMLYAFYQIIEFLTLKEENQRANAATFIYVFEDALNNHITLRGIETDIEATWQEIILGIRRLQFFTRY